jgi:hypothetical protein
MLPLPAKLFAIEQVPVAKPGLAAPSTPLPLI